MFRAVGEKFDEAVFYTINFTDGYIIKRDDDFLIFTIATNKILFGLADCCNFWESFDCANETLVVEGTPGFIGEVTGKTGAFLGGAIGR